NLGVTLLSPTSAQVSGSLAQGIYGDDPATVRVSYGRVDGGTNLTAWERSLLLGLNTNFNPTIFTPTLTNLVPQTTSFYRFYAVNGNGGGWAPATSQFSTETISPVAYASRIRVAFTGYTRDEPLVNFPALVKLPTGLAGFSYAQFASRTGGDLRFTD